MNILDEILKELEWIKSTTLEEITISRIDIIINKLIQYKEQHNESTN